MRNNLYSIYDTVAKVFNKPFVEFNNETAKRSFFESLQEQKHAKDYSLYHIGEYDDHNGQIVPNKEPTRIADGFIKEKAKEVA